MRRYLVVANQTLGGTHLLHTVRELNRSRECRFHILVPATHPHGSGTWTEGDAIAVATERLNEALARFRDVGAQVTGEVGDANPIMAVDDVFRGEAFDEIILSTLPPGLSRWLKVDLLHRVQGFGLPVTHIVGQPEPAR